MTDLVDRRHFPEALAAWGRRRWPGLPGLLLGLTLVVGPQLASGGEATLPGDRPPAPGSRTGAAATAPPEAVAVSPDLDRREKAMKLSLTTTAFVANGEIPEKHTCDDADQSPALTWAGVPAAAKSLVLVVDDPDAPAGTWTHWLLFNLPATEVGLAEGVPAKKELPNRARQGLNDFRRIGYGGPCPPRGKSHRYFFRLYALDSLLDLAPGATRSEVLSAIKGRILAQAELMGTYQRR
ncbi:MAG: YbhB/YbcL family Raf kinase inhibitor-like protein [Thermodesulfobacteriota bacterium]